MSLKSNGEMSFKIPQYNINDMQKNKNGIGKNTKYAVK